MSLDRAHRSPIAKLLTAFFEPEIRAWHGAQPIGMVFWGYGVFVSSILIFLFVCAFHDDHIILQHVMQFCFAAYTIWILVSVWRCAANAFPFWGVLARWLTVAWAGNTALVLLFLQLDLLARYLGP